MVGLRLSHPTAILIWWVYSGAWVEPPASACPGLLPQLPQQINCRSPECSGCQDSSLADIGFSQGEAWSLLNDRRDSWASCPLLTRISPVLECVADLEAGEVSELILRVGLPAFPGVWWCFLSLPLHWGGRQWALLHGISQVVTLLPVCTLVCPL